MSEGRSAPARRPALILDRDGVINVDTGYLHRIEECIFVDGIFDVAKEFAARGFHLVIATNQAGIGRGYYTEEQFATLMAWMRETFRARGAKIAAVYHCPDHPTEGVGRYRRDNPWRKPHPGMILQAAEDLDLDLAASWLVGDKETDILAGRAAGVGMLVLFSPEAAVVTHRDDGAWVVPGLAAIAPLLRKSLAG
jgi:D-glycero-D-manno-heptose 1,7-bisphosphate phosphatase